MSRAAWAALSHAPLVGTTVRAEAPAPVAMGGVHLMLPANANQSFGVELDFIQADARPERRYVAAGLFVENRLFECFLLSIGLMAYVPLDEPRPTPVGFSTKLGWVVPQYHRVINPFAVIRAETSTRSSSIPWLTRNTSPSVGWRQVMGRRSRRETSTRATAVDAVASWLSRARGPHAAPPARPP